MLLKYKNIHIGCIAGIGMSGLAILLKQKGCKITGSDKNLSPGQKWNHMLDDVEIVPEDILPEQTELLLLSSAMQESHPQIVCAKKRNIPIMHRMDMVALLFSELKVLGMLGSHGKTSSTGMLSNILDDQTFLVGGVHQNRGSNAQWMEGSEFAVFETDESDGSFAKIDIFGGVFTTLDREHLPHYNESFDNLKQAFKDYLMRQKNKHLIMLNIDDENLRILYQDCLQLNENTDNFSTYGEHKDADYRIENVRGRMYDLVLPNQTILKDIELGVHGRHFLQNSAGVVALSVALNIPEEKIRKGLKEYKGMQRRLTKLGEVYGVSYIDDYAHHPVEIKASLQALKEEYNRILVFFEPHRYTRLSDLWSDFVEVLSLSEKVYVLPFYGASEKPIDGISSEAFVAEKENFFLSVDIKAEIKAANLTKGDCVVCMGAGYSSKIIKDVYEKLQAE